MEECIRKFQKEPLGEFLMFTEGYTEKTQVQEFLKKMALCPYWGKSYLSGVLLAIP